MRKCFFFSQEAFQTRNPIGEDVETLNRAEKKRVSAVSGAAGTSKVSLVDTQ